MSIKLPVSLAVIALAGAVARNASAVSVFLSDVSPKASMTITFPGLSPETTPYVGQINWSFNRADPSNAGLDAIIPGSTVSTFCIEGTQNVTIGQTSNFVNLFSDISLAPKDNVGSLYTMGSTKAATMNTFWDAYYGQAGLNSVNGAAFQLGIWEILYDTTPDLSSGAFVASATGDADSILAMAQAQNWLANFGTVAAPTHYQLYAFSDPNLQDQIFGVPTAGHSGATPTPLPAGLPAGLALLGALGIARKLRAKPATC